jgi:NAD+ kinase
MKVSICTSREKENLIKILNKYGFEVVTKNPEFVLCYGGDGTTLFSERQYPHVPKLVIKTSELCKQYEYSPKSIDSVLKKLKENEYMILEEIKLNAYFKGNAVTALNEIQVHTKLPIKAIRFSVDAEKKFDNLIGDGVIVSTPFGSTGYYLASGGKQFKEGIGVSFNNIHSRKIYPVIVNVNSKIKIKMNRDFGILLNDNNSKYFDLKEGDEVTIEKSDETARFIQVNA